MNADFLNEQELTFIDNDIKIKITDSVLSILKKYIQDEKANEAGGILIAREDNDNGNIIIEYATEPLKNDKREKFRFYRKDRGHIEFYNKIYHENNKIYAYIGEWHTHPEDYPNPSFLDKYNWKKNCNKKSRNELYNIIIGRKEIKMWKIKKNEVINLSCLI